MAISKLITKQMDWSANMTESNHLGKALLKKPDVMIGAMDTLFSAKNCYSDNPLLSALMGNKKTEKSLDSLEWSWKLKGANTMPLVILSDSTPSAANTAGKYRRDYTITLDHNWYQAGDVICPGTGDKKYQSRVQEDPLAFGKGWRYTLRIMSDDSNMFIPDKFLQAGEQWSKLYSNYEEGAEQSGSTQFSLPLELSNRMSKYRKKYQVTEQASTGTLAVAIPDSKGKFHRSWISYAEVEYWKQWYRELERGAWYQRSAQTVLGATGRPVISGPGVQEQLEDSHIYRYSHLTARLIEEYLMDIFYSRTKPGQGRHIKAYTGEYGMLIFDRVMKDWMARSNFVMNVESMTDVKSTDLNPRTFGVGYQVNKYYMANGSSLELIHMPIYDDREINYEIDPISGYPMESQRITFLDFSGENNSSNIELVTKKDSFAFTYIEGMFGPYGPKEHGTSAHSGDYYEMHVEKCQGTHIKDVSKCGELILTRN